MGVEMACTFGIFETYNNGTDKFPIRVMFFWSISHAPDPRYH